MGMTGGQKSMMMWVERQKKNVASQKSDAEKVAEARAKIDAFLADRKDGETPNEFNRRLAEWIDKNPTACP